ncbi:MAG: ATP-binding protein [Chloroflexota bacterium]
MGDRTWQSRLFFFVSGLCVLVLVGQTLLFTVGWLNKPFPGFFVHENLTVGPHYTLGWSGVGAGLRSLDQITGVDGRELRDRAELYNIVRRAPVGSPFQYQVRRDGRTVKLTVSSMSLGLRDWFLSFGLYVVIGLAFLLVGAAPYFYHASSAVALPLGFMALMVFVWFQTTFDFVTDGVLPKELRIFALTLTPSAAIHLALLLRNMNLAPLLRHFHLAGIYGIGAVLGAFNSATYFAPLWIWLMTYRSVYIFVCVGAAAFLGIIGRALRRCQSDLDRSRLRVMFVGALIGFWVPAVTTVVAAVFDLPIPFNIALIPTIVFPISVTYALLKYSLFDLGNTLKVAVSRLALFGLLIALYAVVAILVAPWAGKYAKDPLVPIVFSILVVAIFNPLLRWLERVVDRYIYRQEYDAGMVQSEISLFLRTLKDVPALAQGFIRGIAQPLGITEGCVLYRAKNMKGFVTASTEPTSRMAPAVAAAYGAAVELLEHATERGVLRDEATTNPRYRDIKKPFLDLFDRCNAALFIPLVYEGEVRGVICFGAKRSGQEYSAEDLSLLATLTEQLALSLENGRLYQEAVEARQKAEASNQRLLEMDRVKKDFVANICHELRTPVSTIIGFGEILSNPNFSGDPRDMLNRLVNNSQELSKLMDNLMNFSRMEADGPATQFELVKLREILAALELMTQRLIRERPIEFGVRLDSAVDTIESDGQKLQQILVQLLTNALKFTEKGRIELSIRKRGEAGRELVEIAIADTGIGIKREDQEVIFDDFRQIENSSTRRYGGTGLGLGLCKKLAAALGGEIRVASEYGVGSVFSLLLPIRVAESEAA